MNYDLMTGLRQKLAPTTIVSSAPTSGEAVARIEEARLAPLNSFYQKLANTSPHTLKWVIGDRMGLVGAVHRLGTPFAIADVPTAVQTCGDFYAVKATSTTLGGAGTSDIMADSFTHPVLVKEIILKAKVSSDSLDNDVELLLADIGGQKNNEYIRLGEYTTEDQYNEKIKRIKVPNGFVLSDFRALTMNVPAGEEITMTFLVAGAGGRN